jgi:hypothetical protein
VTKRLICNFAAWIRCSFQFQSSLLSVVANSIRSQPDYFSTNLGVHGLLDALRVCFMDGTYKNKVLTPVSGLNSVLKPLLPIETLDLDSTCSSPISSPLYSPLNSPLPSPVHSYKSHTFSNIPSPSSSPQTSTFISAFPTPLESPLHSGADTPSDSTKPNANPNLPASPKSTDSSSSSQSPNNYSLSNPESYLSPNQNPNQNLNPNRNKNLNLNPNKNLNPYSSPKNDDSDKISPKTVKRKSLINALNLIASLSQVREDAIDPSDRLDGDSRGNSRSGSVDGVGESWGESGRSSRKNSWGESGKNSGRDSGRDSGRESRSNSLKGSRVSSETFVYEGSLNNDDIDVNKNDNNHDDNVIDNNANDNVDDVGNNFNNNDRDNDDNYVLNNCNNNSNKNYGSDDELQSSPDLSSNFNNPNSSDDIMSDSNRIRNVSFIDQNLNTSTTFNSNSNPSSEVAKMLTEGSESKGVLESALELVLENPNPNPNANANANPAANSNPNSNPNLKFSSTKPIPTTNPTSNPVSNPISNPILNPTSSSISNPSTSPISKPPPILDRHQRCHLRGSVLAMIKSLTQHFASEREIRPILLFMSACKDAIVVVELAQLLLCLLVEGGSKIVCVITEVCKGPEEFAAFIIQKMIKSSHEDLRCIGLRLLTHFYLRVDLLPVSWLMMTLKRRKSSMLSRTVEKISMISGTLSVRMGVRFCTTLMLNFFSVNIVIIKIIVIIIIIIIITTGGVGMRRLQACGGLALLEETLGAHTKTSTDRTYVALLEMLLTKVSVRVSVRVSVNIWSI